MQSYDTGAISRDGAGQPIISFYKNLVTEKHHIVIQHPGDTTYKYDQPVTEDDKIKYAAMWEAYEAGASKFEGQTLVTDVPWIDAATANMLRTKNVHTLEHLAAVSDDRVKALGLGMMPLRDRARGEMEQQRKAAEFDTVKADVEASIRSEYEDRLAKLEAMIANQAKPKPQRQRKAA